MIIPYRSDHVGGLLRPQSLIDARLAFEAGTLSADSLCDQEDRAIIDVLALQRSTGIQILSDGEFRRTTWGDGMLERLKGLGTDASDATRIPHWKGGNKDLANTTVPGIRSFSTKSRLPSRLRFKRFVS